MASEKQPKLQDDCPHTLVSRENGTKQCARPASADFCRASASSISFSF
jgi:hypothetical protein